MWTLALVIMMFVMPVMAFVPFVRAPRPANDVGQNVNRKQVGSRAAVLMKVGATPCGTACGGCDKCAGSVFNVAPVDDLVCGSFANTDVVAGFGSGISTRKKASRKKGSGCCECCPAGCPCCEGGCTC